MVLVLAAMAGKWPAAIWFLLPALLPVANFSPWTGWWLFDESDLLVLACLAGAYGGVVLKSRPVQSTSACSGRFTLLWNLLATSLVVGLWRGFSDTDFVGAVPALAIEGALYAGYDSAWNSLRVAKSLLWALMLGGLLKFQDRAHGTVVYVARGMVVGLGLVCAAALWERAIYVGLFDFNLPYRSSAWFWEMHIGGGAIDAYLAMGVPFAFWAVWTAPTAWRWVAANMLLAGAVYTLLTTYSRGVYLAVAISLLWMVMCAWRLKLVPAIGSTWGNRTLVSMLLVLGVEAAMVFGTGSFMSDRLSRADVDMAGRLTHWRSGVNLLKTPADWLTGLGFGRFPAHYSRSVEGGDFPGRAVWQRDNGGQPHVLLSGPPSDDRRIGYFALTQRVEMGSVGNHRVRVHLRSAAPAELMVSVCERHLFYEFRCQWSVVVAKGASQDASEVLEATLEGDSFANRGFLEIFRHAVVAISMAEAGSTVRLDSLELFDVGAVQLLQNSAFSLGLQHWFPMTLGQFQPWHIDNLYLDILIDRGLLGMLVLALWLVWVAAALRRARRGAQALAWVMAGSLLGVLSIGAVISVTEVPRVALILMILLWSSSAIRGQIEEV